MIGYAICGSFCTHKASLEALKLIKREYGDVLPILSFNAAKLDTRFGKADELVRACREICAREPLMTIPETEPIGPKLKLDLLIIAPCTGNTLAKLACGITDTPVTMAAKAHLRSSRPLLIALASNDALGANLKSIAMLTEKKNVYFVPMLQDDVKNKPYSLVARHDMIVDAAHAAVSGEQLRPLFLA